MFALRFRLRSVCNNIQQLYSLPSKLLLFRKHLLINLSIRRIHKFLKRLYLMRLKLQWMLVFSNSLHLVLFRDLFTREHLLIVVQFRILSRFFELKCSIMQSMLLKLLNMHFLCLFFLHLWKLFSKWLLYFCLSRQWVLIIKSMHKLQFFMLRMLK